jgi:hypothetical protein
VLQWRAPAAYRRHRELLVFALHVIFTHLRAICVASMVTEAATGWKGGAVAEGQRQPLGSGESPPHLLVRLVMVSGVLFRIVETVSAAGGRGGVAVSRTNYEAVGVAASLSCGLLAPLRAPCRSPPDAPTWPCPSRSLGCSCRWPRLP